MIKIYVFALNYVYKLRYPLDLPNALIFLYFDIKEFERCQTVHFNTICNRRTVQSYLLSPFVNWCKWCTMYWPAT
jgi:hypothetical protein